MSIQQIVTVYIAVNMSEENYEDDTSFRDKLESGINNLLGSDVGEVFWITIEDHVDQAEEGGFD